MEDSKLSYQIIRGAIEVHRALGPGLLESAYQECLQYELSEYGLYVEREKPMPIVYKEVRLNHGYRMDLLVEGRIVVETKTVETLTDVHFAQLLTYLKLGKFRLGLLINFHVTLLKQGVSRVLNPELRNSA
ncbi:GxxExxY protein [Larkinella punicea]|uniref:GxxExxY protein n=1 Tax=Larkinella punicea TaxID=2315727 RepID=A0A368JPU7_9BACT|nr:GxxExxY protein [Larkinella punicea]RCR68201.1 GxxExxY protein [Larkinella punicea]